MAALCRESAVTAPQGKTYEVKLAAVIRLMGSPVRGEALSAFDALGRLLASRGVTFTDFGDAVEKLARRAGRG